VIPTKFFKILKKIAFCLKFKSNLNKRLIMVNPQNAVMMPNNQKLWPAKGGAVEVLKSV